MSLETTSFNLLGINARCQRDSVAVFVQDRYVSCAVIVNARGEAIIALIERSRVVYFGSDRFQVLIVHQVVHEFLKTQNHEKPDKYSSTLQPCGLLELQFDSRSCRLQNGFYGRKHA